VTGPRARAWGARGRECRGLRRSGATRPAQGLGGGGWLGARVAAPGGGGGGGDDGRLGAWAAALRGGSGRGDGDVRAFSACGHFEIRQKREGKRSMGSFEAQIYSSVNRRIYLGRATWALPRIFIGYR
jgi:hypothetical protein